MSRNPSAEPPPEIPVVGDLGENAAGLCEKLLSVPPGSRCTLYFDSPGGSSYCAISLATLIALRRLQATGIVTGECSSAALWPLAACRRRIVTRFSVLLFHPMRWHSEENVRLAEAQEWARHFGELERDMDQLLADLFGLPLERLNEWVLPGRYVTGPEFAAAGLGELVDVLALARRGRRPAHTKP